MYIFGYTSNRKECFYTNRALAQKVGITIRHLQKGLATLQERGLLSVYEKGGKRYMSTTIPMSYTTSPHVPDDIPPMSYTTPIIDKLITKDNKELSVSKKTETRPSNPANAVMKEYIDVWNEIAEQQHMVPVNEEDKKAVTKAAVMVNKLLKSWPTINASKLTQIKANAALTPDYLKRILLTAIDKDWFMLCAKDSVHDIATILAEKNFIKMLIAINKSRSIA
jgi:hypothetical protein